MKAVSWPLNHARGRQPPPDKALTGPTTTGPKAEGEANSFSPSPSKPLQMPPPLCSLLQPSQAELVAPSPVTSWHLACPSATVWIWVHHNISFIYILLPCTQGVCVPGLSPESGSQLCAQKLAGGIVQTNKQRGNHQYRSNCSKIHEAGSVAEA